jgi:cytochrome c6
MRTHPLLLATALAAFAVVAPVRAADAPANWTKHCASCHAPDGSGNTRMGRQSGAKDYRDAKVQAEMKDDAALKALKDGMQAKGKEVMKPFKDKLSEDEMKALIAHMRTFKK